MRAGWFLLRWLGLLALLFLGVWVGERLARADGQVTPPPTQTSKTDKKPRRAPPADTVPTTPPGFPFGPPGGSSAPANPGSTQRPGWQLHF